MLQAVINISEGRDLARLNACAVVVGPSCLDVHSDAWHNRSVFTLASADIVEDALALARRALELFDYAAHDGVHPRLGIVDVVPFTPFGSTGLGDGIDLSPAIAARDDFAARAAVELGLSCFCYGPERSLPEIRKHAFAGLLPDTGPETPDPHKGSCCVGARGALVAYNLWLKTTDLSEAKALARELRSPAVRTLALVLDGRLQLSMNLVAPLEVGPLDVYEQTEAITPIDHAELVGLLPERVLEKIPESRWHELDLAPERTVEGRFRTQR